VVADGRAAHDPFDGLRRIGIDEISYKRGYRYLLVVVDHDGGRLIWAAMGARNTEHHMEDPSTPPGRHRHDGPASESQVPASESQAEDGIPQVEEPN
jgi:hypothetical protein